jgi:1-acyl-sn-glycerol-3-phosphate acyltransferase
MSRDFSLKIFFCLCRWLVLLIVRIFYRFEVRGRENIPAEGSYIVACNHASYLDPLFLQSGFKRQLSILTWDKVCDKAPRLFRWLKAIPVSDEKNNFEAMKVALKRLRQGELLGIFPEGGLGPEGLGDFKDGAARISLRSGKVLLPVGLIGNRATYPRDGRLRIFKKVVLSVAEPLSPMKAGQKKSIEELNRELKIAVKSLISP